MWSITNVLDINGYNHHVLALPRLDLVIWCAVGVHKAPFFSQKLGFVNVISHMIWSPFLFSDISAAKLQRHLPNMYVIFQEFDNYGKKIK